MKTRRQVLKKGAAAVVVAVPAVAVAEQLLGGAAGGGMTGVNLAVPGCERTAIAQPTHHSFTFEVFVEGDIDTARRVFRVLQKEIIEGPPHEALRGINIGVNSSKVTPVQVGEPV